MVRRSFLGCWVLEAVKFVNRNGAVLAGCELDFIAIEKRYLEVCIYGLV